MSVSHVCACLYSVLYFVHYLITMSTSTSALLSLLPFQPTPEQADALQAMAQTLLPDSGMDFFILRGSAGTGKTSIMKAVVGWLDRQGMRIEVMAPTGRAAKVLSRKAGVPTRTLHNLLYRVNEVKDEKGEVTHIEFVPRTDYPEVPTVFVVDEASMLSMLPPKADGYMRATNSLFEQLLTFMQQGCQGCKLLLVGDHYQLPPVGEDHAQALDERVLQRRFGLSGRAFQMSQVMRQLDGSPVLREANMLRAAMDDRMEDFRPRVGYLPSEAEAVRRFVQELQLGDERAVMIAFTNASVQSLNGQVRALRYGPAADALMPGELVVVNRTAYHPAYLPAGDMGKVLQLVGSPKLVGDMRFQEADLQFWDEEGKPLTVRKMVDLSLLGSEKGERTYDQERMLYAAAMKNNEVFRNSKQPKDDSYLSALQLRYAYAVTCHKAQGGEWETVFIHPYRPKGMQGLNWHYTALTRARTQAFTFQQDYRPK